MLLLILACATPIDYGMWQPSDTICRYDYGVCPYTCWPVEPAAYVESAWECTGDPDAPNAHDDCIEASSKYFGDEAYDQICIYCTELPADTGGDPAPQTYIRAQLCLDRSAPDSGVTTTR